LDSRSWKADFEMGVAYEALKDYNLAIVYYKKATEINPNNEYPYYQLGRIYQKQGALKTAIAAYKKTLSLNPNLADAHYSIGVCYEKTGNKALAKTEYIEALKYIKDYKEAQAALKRLE
jgi:tetratricopeptide (TPR) repeat protein